MRRKQHRREKTGTPPGTLTYLGKKGEGEVFINLIRYGEGFWEQTPISSPGELPEADGEGSKYWLNVDGIHNKEIIEEIGKKFHIHSLTLEDIMNAEQRPKIEFHPGYLFLVMKMLSYDSQEQRVDVEQVSFIITQEYLLTFQEKKGDVFDPVRKRLHHGAPGKIQRLPIDYLAYSLMDMVVDHYYILMEALGDQIEDLELEVLEGNTYEISGKIHGLKKELLAIRRAVWPLRDVVVSLQRNDSPLIHQETEVFLRDLYDHVIQVIETGETARDLLANLMELQVSTNSNRMNETMKVLTIIATIFIPLTFIVGVYGMNFTHMPELAWKWSYPLVMGFMLLLAIMMVQYFKRKKWL